MLDEIDGGTSSATLTISAGVLTNNGLLQSLSSGAGTPIHQLSGAFDGSGTFDIDAHTDCWRQQPGCLRRIVNVAGGVNLGFAVAIPSRWATAPHWMALRAGFLR
ncbi:MAG: hypothetical protein U5O39_11905 [Gammaproteobacteria bacterium]|nr:hypothetical protein [Gammaproteobacteria bacterium]